MTRCNRTRDPSSQDSLHCGRKCQHLARAASLAFSRLASLHALYSTASSSLCCSVDDKYTCLLKYISHTAYCRLLFRITGCVIEREKKTLNFRGSSRLFSQHDVFFSVLCCSTVDATFAY